MNGNGYTAPDRSNAAESPTIVWDPGTLVCVQTGATYGRMIRLPKGEGILCSYEKGGKSWVCHSRDEGKTWIPSVLVKELPDAAAANPELLLLRSGRLLLFYNQRPRNQNLQEKQQSFGIGYCFSDDGGKTWRATEKLLYKAGTTPEVGCWEPAAVQLPSGEIQLFFANEFPYPANADQEITRMRSRDNGTTWSSPETFSFRAGHRDGMPVPLQLKNGTLVVAIEDNGLIPGAKLQPALLSGSESRNRTQAVIGGSDPRRWGAIVPPLRREVYAGAPYLRQFPGGETVLSCQSEENQDGGTARTKQHMVVYVGDSRARNFRHPSEPFRAAGAGSDIEGLWNSLLVKSDRTVTAISDTTIQGKRGLWAIDGRLVPRKNTIRR